MIKACRSLRVLSPFKSGIRNVAMSPCKTLEDPNAPIPLKFDAKTMNMLGALPCTRIDKLTNGLKVVTHPRLDTNLASVGLFFESGSIYEDLNDNGMALFFEYLVFNGTLLKDRNTLHKQMSCTGAKFKAVTQRDFCGYYFECLGCMVPLVTEILAECVYSNALNTEQIEYQKQIFYQSIAEYDKDSNKLVYDFLIKTAYQGTPLAKPVYGSINNLKNFDCRTIKLFLDKFIPPKIGALVSVGNVDHNIITNLAYKHLVCFDSPTCPQPEQLYRYTSSSLVYRDDSQPMAHVALGVEVPGFTDHDHWTLDVIREMVGGWDRTQYTGDDHSNIVGQACKYLEMAAYETFNIKFKQGGLFGVHYMAPSLLIDDVMMLITDEFLNICTNPTPPQVERAKRQAKTKFLNKFESSENLLLDIAKWMLFTKGRFSHWPSLIERVHYIDNVTVNNVKSIAERYFFDKLPVVAALGPTEGLPDMNRFNAYMHWSRL